jgi:hypothetical protein
MAATSRASPTSGSDSGSDSGMVTIEAAIALCAFISVLALVLAAMSMVFDQLRCIDAAREAARLVARGEQDGAADVVHRIAPTDATYAITTSGDGIVVAVRDPDSLLPGVDLHADAYAVQEPTGDDEPTTTPAPAQPGGSAAVPEPSGATGPAAAEPSGAAGVEPGGPAAGDQSHLGAAPVPGGHDVPAAGEAPTSRPSGSSAVPESGYAQRPAAHESSRSVEVPGFGNGRGPDGERPTDVPGSSGKNRQAADGLSRSTGGGGR